VADTKFFFLVAGYDYERGGSRNGLAFGEMCTGRVAELVDSIDKNHGKADALVTADATLRFLRFSVEFGKIEVIDRAFSVANGIKNTTILETTWQTLTTINAGDRNDPNTFVSKGPFRAINQATDYAGQVFQQGAATSNVMSIVDVYRSVRGAPDGSVLELSFFSHAWVQGPIMVNSSDTTHDPNLRDPGDKDGRSALDFNISMGEAVDSTVTSISKMFLFGSRFDPKGIMRVWGCDFDIENVVLQQTMKQIKKAGDADNTAIDFDFSDPRWPKRYRLIDPKSQFLPSDAGTTSVRCQYAAQGE
jgi:hypothetical protein